jgi:hypothetical protein
MSSAMLCILLAIVAAVLCIANPAMMMYCIVIVCLVYSAANLFDSVTKAMMTIAIVIACWMIFESFGSALVSVGMCFPCFLCSLLLMERLVVDLHRQLL